MTDIDHWADDLSSSRPLIRRNLLHIRQRTLAIEWTRVIALWRQVNGIANICIWLKL